MSQQSQQVFSGRYELVRPIARGGMAEVFLAHDLMLDRRVALKVLFRELSTDPSFVERFRREAQAAANLSHPNIVSIFDWGEEDGTYFIVMEYVEGRTLGQIIRSEGPLLPDRAADIAAEVAAALAFAHRSGVVHRDVKPGNVLINADGQVKVTDFGIARAAQQGDVELTQTGAVMGTATYFSPEQAQGQRVDGRTDVYALGVVLYEMITGQPPFQGDNPMAIAYKHVREQPLPPRQVNPDVPAAFQGIVLQAMAKNPADRYASADELRADLIRWRQGRQPLANPTVVAPVVAEPATTMAVPAADRTRVVTGGAVPTEPPPDDRRNGAFVVLLLVMLAVLAGLLWLFAREAGLLGGSGTAERVAVPLVIGQTQEQAEEAVRDAGLVPEIQAEPSDQPQGIVFNQNPKAEVQVDEGSSVVLFVSAGVEQIEVPDVVGREQAVAERLLREAGFQVSAVPEESDDVPEGEVISQSPEAMEMAPRDSIVEIRVSSGEALVEVPDVVGETAESAANQLGRAGFEAQRAEEASTEVERGRVIRTDPPAGRQAAEGSVVTYVVSTGPPPPAKVTVPNVIGMTRDDAKARIEAAGLKFQEGQTVPSNPQEDGKVVAQNPSGGQKVDEGSTVTVRVGKAAASTTEPDSSTTTPLDGSGD